MNKHPEIRSQMHTMDTDEVLWRVQTLETEYVPKFDPDSCFSKERPMRVWVTRHSGRELNERNAKIEARKRFTELELEWLDENSDLWEDFTPQDKVIVPHEVTERSVAGVVIKGPFSADERDKIGQETANLFADPTRNTACASERREIVEGWDLDMWLQGALVIVPELFHVEPDNFGSLPKEFPIGLQMRMGEKLRQVLPGVTQSDLGRRWQNDPENSVLVLVAEQTELADGVVDQVIARPVWASVVRLRSFNDVEEIRGSVPTGVPVPESCPIGSVVEHRELAICGLPEAQKTRPPEVIDTAPVLMHGVADSKTDLYPWELVGANDVESYFSRFVVVVAANGVRVVALCPNAEHLIHTRQMRVRPLEASVDGEYVRMWTRVVGH